MNYKINRIVSLLFLCLSFFTQANAESFQVNITGIVNTISSEHGEFDENTPFKKGDIVEYSVTFDETTTADANRSDPSGFAFYYESITSFSASIGNYNFSGNSGNGFIMDNFTSSSGGDARDQFSIRHSILDSGFNDRNDLSNAEPINGLNLASASFSWATSTDTTFLSSTDFDISIIQSLIENPQIAYTTKFAILVFKAPENIGPFPDATVTISIDSISIGAQNSSASPYGVLTKAHTLESRFGNSVERFDSAVNDPSDFDAYSAVFSTHSGGAVGRGELVYGNGLANNSSVTPGIEVGAYASSSSRGASVASSVGFRTYQYLGDEPIRATLNAQITGEIESDGGHLGAFTDISVIDSIIFNKTLPNDPNQLESFFFGNYNFNNHPTDRFSSGELTYKNDSFVVYSPFNKPTNTSFTVQPNQSFTVLLYIAVSSTGGGSVKFLSTLSSAPDFFTDEGGYPIDTIVPVGDAPTVINSAALNQSVLSIKDLINNLDLSSFIASNDGTRENRRKALLNMLDEILAKIEIEVYQDAINQLETILLKTDGEFKPRDWISEPNSIVVKKKVNHLISNILLVCEECKSLAN